MQLSGTPMPGYKIYEYLLVLNPPEALREKIMQVKKYFSETFENNTGLYAGPQILLANFLQYGIKEERMVNRLKSVAMGQTPLKIELKDYGSFPSHTIFINVASRLPVDSLVRKIRKETQMLMKMDKENKPHFTPEAQITIARKLLPWQYEKGWLEFSHKQFTGRFIADSMLLMRRPVGEKKYEVLRRFEFENLPVNTTQGNLF